MIHADQDTTGVSGMPSRDVTVHSSRTRLRGVKALNVEARPWVDPFPPDPDPSYSVHGNTPGPEFEGF